MGGGGGVRVPFLLLAGINRGYLKSRILLDFGTVYYLSFQRRESHFSRVKSAEIFSDVGDRFM